MTSKTLFKYWLLALGFASSYGGAAEFNPLVGNPFVFCSAPRPCKYCQPWRKIYNEICDSQSDAKQHAEEDVAALRQEVEARNRDITAAKIEAARQGGADALISALQQGDTIFRMDENTPDLTSNAFAAGWNSEWLRRRNYSD